MRAASIVQQADEGPYIGEPSPRSSPHPERLRPAVIIAPLSMSVLVLLARPIDT